MLVEGGEEEEEEGGEGGGGVKEMINIRYALTGKKGVP